MTEHERGSLQELMAGLAHELYTPLGAIRSNRDVLQRVIARLSDILADEAVEEDEVEQIRGLVKTLDEVVEVDQLAVDMITDLVASVRDHGRTDEAIKRSVDLHEGLESTLLLLGHELKHRIEVVKEYSDLPRVECFPSQLNQVFTNLLLNASQAIADEGTITIRSYAAAGDVVVEISDTGSGIAPQDLERVFDVGFTTKPTPSGIGLGLGICREIVERQGGRIEVESRVGEGSTFRVILPVGAGEASAAR
ncbi:MAG: ATPase [Gemmatimonadota bacterium]|nr:MAG: ATPase [Gemmatimonadota bacterium]